jgi:hypothetical protein
MVDQTFVRFFVAFVVIVGAAFGILAIAGSQVEEVEPEVILANPTE